MDGAAGAASETTTPEEVDADDEAGVANRTSVPNGESLIKQMVSESRKGSVVCLP